MTRKIRIVKTEYHPSTPKEFDLSLILDQGAQKRFWTKVDKRGPKECWNFTGSKNKHGYGSIRITFGYRKSRLVSAHVFSLMTATKKPNKKYALHTCNNRACVNPRHLYWGTKSQNGIDARNAGTIGVQKLNWDAVNEIREMLELGFSTRAVATSFGVSPALIWQIKSNRQWKVETLKLNKVA